MRPDLAEPPLPAGPARPRRTRWPWWLGGGTLLVAVAITATVLATRSPAPAEQVIAHVPADACALLTRATIDTYAPQTTCDGSADSTVNDWTLRSAGWLPPVTHAGQPVSAVIDLILDISTAAHPDSDAAARTEQDCQDWESQPALHGHSVAGVGDQACASYRVYQGYPTAAIAVRVRNAMIELSYDKVDDPVGNPHFTAQQADQALQAMVADVVRQLN